jgi:hypothetical protein
MKRQDSWAAPARQMDVRQVPAGAISRNVHGRTLTGPLQGFGQLWQKTYRARLSGVRATPREVVATWKANFPSFWPEGNHFYAPMAGIKPGEIAHINVNGPGDLPLFSTGVRVIYADEESFTFMTPIGHPFAGWVTFSAYEEDGATVAQAQVLIRANDPLYELGFRLGFLHKAEDQVWHHTLKSLADEFGVKVPVEQQVTCVDTRIQWGEARNIWYNAGLRTALYLPVALVKKIIGR